MGSFQDKADLDAAAHTTRDVMAFRLGLPDHDAALSGSQETEGTLGTHNDTGHEHQQEAAVGFAMGEDGLNGSVKIFYLVHPSPRLTTSLISW